MISLAFQIVQPINQEFRLAPHYSIIDFFQIGYLASKLLNVPRLDCGPRLLFEIVGKPPSFSSITVILNDLFSFLKPVSSTCQTRLLDLKSMLDAIEDARLAGAGGVLIGFRCPEILLDIPLYLFLF